MIVYFTIVALPVHLRSMDQCFFTADYKEHCQHALPVALIPMTHSYIFIMYFLYVFSPQALSINEIVGQCYCPTTNYTNITSLTNSTVW